MLHFHKKVTLYSTSLPATMTDTAPSALGVNHQMFSQLAAVSLPSITISLGQTADMTRHTLMCLTFAIMKQSITQMYQERMSTFTHSNISAKLSFLIPCQTTERKETFYFTSPIIRSSAFFFLHQKYLEVAAQELINVCVCVEDKNICFETAGRKECKSL